jgi:hypothetical protein
MPNKPNLELTRTGKDEEIKMEQSNDEKEKRFYANNVE